MFQTGILNPQILSLLGRVRHTNTLVIADRGFPFFPSVETIDLTLVDDIPTVLQVLAAIRPNFIINHAFMAEEFRTNNTSQTQVRFSDALAGIEVKFLPHPELKDLVPDAVGLIRTADTVQYANMILESA